MRTSLAFVGVVIAGIIGGVVGGLIVRPTASGLPAPITETDGDRLAIVPRAAEPDSPQPPLAPGPPGASPKVADQGAPPGPPPAAAGTSEAVAEWPNSEETAWAKGWVPETPTVTAWIRAAPAFTALSDSDRAYVLSATPHWLRGRVDDVFSAALPEAGRELREAFARGYAVALIPSMARTGRSGDSWVTRYKSGEVSWATYMLQMFVDVFRIGEEAELGELREWRRAFAKQHLTDEQAARIEQRVEAFLAQQRRSAATLEAHYRPLIEAGK